jgi:hypothetical protein
MFFEISSLWLPTFLHPDFSTTLNACSIIDPVKVFTPSPLYPQRTVAIAAMVRPSSAVLCYGGWIGDLS